LFLLLYVVLVCHITSQLIIILTTQKTAKVFPVSFKACNLRTLRTTVWKIRCPQRQLLGTQFYCVSYRLRYAWWWKVPQPWSLTPAFWP